MKLAHVGLAAGALGLAVGLYVVRSGEGPAVSEREVAACVPAADAGRGEDVRQEVAALKSQVAQLSAEVTSLRWDVLQSLADARAPSAAGAAGGTPGEGEGELGAAGEQDFEHMLAAREEDQVRHQERMAALDAALENDPIDPSWSAQATGVLQQALAEDDGGSVTPGSLVCRSSMCRVEITVKEGDGADKVAMKLPHRVGEMFPNAEGNQVEEDDGATTLVLYLFRAGHAPPS
jgi:hypothetical protein